MSTSIISDIVEWASRRRAVVLIGLLCLSLASVAGVRRLSFDADILVLLPQNGRVIPAFREFFARFGTLDQLYVVFTAAEGHAVNEYRDEIAAWVEQLRMAPEIATVDSGTIDRSRDFGWLAGRQLLLLRGEQLDEALRRLTPDGLAREVARSRELLTLPSPDIGDLVQQDPAGLLELLRPAIGGTAGANATPSIDGYVTADGRSRVILARPRRPPFDSEFSRALDQRLRRIEAALQPDPVPAADPQDDDVRGPMRVEFAGGHRIAVETEQVVRRESMLNTVGSLVMILPLLFIAFRSFWLITVGALPAAVSLLFVLGALGFLGSRLSAAGTGAAAMLFGLGIDGVVLLYVAYLRPHGDTETGGTASRISGPASSMLLGMWTTAATFYGLAFVDFPSLQQLGLLIGHSMAICGVVTLLLVPALLPRHAPRGRARATSMSRLPQWIKTCRRPILVTAAGLTCVLGIASSGLRVNPTIGSAFGLPTNVYIVLAEGADLNALLETNERLAQRITTEVPGVGMQAPSWFLPSVAAQTRTGERIAGSGLTAAAVRSSLERAAAQSGFRSGVFEPFAARLPELLDTSQRVRYDDYVTHGLGDLVSRFVVRDQERWLLATYVFPASEDQMSRVQTIVEQVDSAQTLTGLPAVNHELARTFTGSFSRAWPLVLFSSSCWCSRRSEAGAYVSSHSCPRRWVSPGPGAFWRWRGSNSISSPRLPS
jgi:predicted exporter